MSKRLILVLLFGTLLYGVPDLVFAQSLAEYAGCSGPDCSTCNLVDLANGVIQWVIGILFVVFAGVMAWAGFGLVTSNGNHHALDEAKGYFVNAIVGFIIMLSAWLIIDTVMRGLVGTSSNPGSVRVMSGWLFWAEVECYEQTEAQEAPEWQNPDPDYVPSNFWPGDSSSPAGEVVSSQICDPTPAGNVNCTNAQNACRQKNLRSRVDTSNSTNHRVTCIQPLAGTGAGTAPQGSGSTGCSGGACVPLTIPCAKQNSCSIASDMVSRLAAMHRAAGVSGARVTEAMPPTRKHISSCHRNGTCIDYSKSGGMTGAEIARVVSAARQNGLRAVYEVDDASLRQRLINQGAPAENVLLLDPGWISAPHFSVYAN